MSRSFGYRYRVVGLSRSMIVLGIDPGLAKFGYGLVAYERGGIRYCEAGCITTPATAPVADRLVIIARELARVLDARRPNRIILERLIPGPNRNLGKVAEVRGVVLLASGERRIPVEEISPKALKVLTTRSGDAGKMQMCKTVQRLLGLRELPSADTADALALAILGSARTIHRPSLRS